MSQEIDDADFADGETTTQNINEVSETQNQNTPFAWAALHFRLDFQHSQEGKNTLDSAFSPERAESFGTSYLIALKDASRFFVFEVVFVKFSEVLIIPCRF